MLAKISGIAIVMILVLLASLSVNADNCKLPLLWEEVGLIFNDCNLKEISKTTNYSDTFSPTGANGSFNYCNTLIWRQYETDKGNIFTYEKVRYQHYPNSEVGEYRAPVKLYEEMMNSRPCVPSGDVWSDSNSGELTNDDMSSLLFPSRNLPHDTYKPDYWASFFNRHYSDYAWGTESKDDTIEAMEFSLDEYRTNANDVINNTIESESHYNFWWIIAACLIAFAFINFITIISKKDDNENDEGNNFFVADDVEQNNSNGSISDEEFKALYRKVIKKYHPDSAQSDIDKKFRNELTVKLNKAYHEKDIDTLRLFE